MPCPVSIVIPLYQRADLTAACLASLERTGTLERAELVMVDNASTDGTPELCAAWADRATIITNPVNMGFAAACNQGVRAATGDVVILLNLDTEVHDGWLDPLLDAVADPAVGVAGSRLLYPGGRIQHAGMAVMPGCITVHIHRYVPGDHPVVTRTRDLAIVTGACMAMRRDLYLEMGGFDEGYRNGFEDTDLCLRLASRGLVARYCGDSVVTHHESMSPGRLDHDHVNGARFRARWGTWEPDLRRLLAEDGIDDAPPDVLWRGPLLDGSEAAAAGREAVAALSAAGHRPAVLEVMSGDAIPGADMDLGLVAAINRLYLSRGPARVFHHVAPGGPSPAPVAGALLVIVAGPGGRGLPPLPAPDAAVALDADAAEALGAALPGVPCGTGDPGAIADALLGPVPERPEGVGYWGPSLGPGHEAGALRGLLRTLTAGDRPVRLVPTDANVPGAGQAPLPDLGPQDFLPGLWVAGGAPVSPGGDADWDRLVGAAGGLLAGWCWADATAFPPAWHEALRRADDVWVTHPEALPALAAAGVPEDRRAVVPPAVDTSAYRPREPREPGAPVEFLAVTGWNWLGGWDLALRAFVEEFAAGEAVRLRLAVREAPAPGVDPEREAVNLLARLGLDPAAVADIDLVTRPPDEATLARAFRAADAVVHVPRGDGLGLPVLRAMACGVPVICVAGVAQSALVGEAGITVPSARDAVVAAPGTDPALAGLRAVEADLTALRAAMRAVQAAPEAYLASAAGGVDRLRAYAGAPAVEAAVAERIAAITARHREAVAA
ncbi:MAG: glycosyltransferase [Thermoleophilia bacterium]